MNAKQFVCLFGAAVCVALAASADAAAPLKVRLGVLSGAAQTALVVGVEKGYFAQQGFDVEVKHLVGGIQGSQALASGQVDWSAGGVEPTIIAAANGLPFKPYAMYAKGGDSYGILVRKEAGIRQISDLRGKKVAVSPGSAPVQGFDRLLKAAGVPADSVKRVQASFTSMGQMLIQGAVDAIVGIEPYLTLTQQKMGGNGVILTRMGRLVQGGGFFFISDAWAKQHPDKLEPAVQALWAAEQFVRHHPDQAAAMEAAFIKADKSVVDASFRYLTFDPTVDEFTSHAFDDTVQYLLAHQLIPQAVKGAKVLAEAHRIEASLRQKHPELLR